MVLAIEAKNLRYVYPDGTVGLDNASIEVKEGESLVVLGPNGSGKSTLLMLIAGLLKPDKGYVKIFGKDIDEYRNLRKDVGIVFQNADDYLFNPTVRDELEFSLIQLGYRDYREKALKIAKEFKIEHLLEKPPFRLSEGEKKKVAIASMLTINPKIVLFDEPTSFLDYNSKREIIEIIKKLKGKKTIVTVTHESNIVPYIADKVVLLNKEKKTFAEGNVREIFYSNFLEEAGVEPPEIVKLFKKLKICKPTTIEEAFDIFKHVI